MKNMKAKSPLKWATPDTTPFVHRDPKIEFSQKKIVILQQELVDDFFRFGVCSDD